MTAAGQEELLDQMNCHTHYIVWPRGQQKKADQWQSDELIPDMHSVIFLYFITFNHATPYPPCERASWGHKYIENC